jgi:Mak10 subunit, NatC N(alpha)-terminal acetyltransferase
VTSIDDAETDVVQIMDTKMDSGHLEPGETLEDEYDVLRNVLPEEVIGIMDQILCHEVSYCWVIDLARKWEKLIIFRLRGIWAIHFRRLSLLVCILNGCCGQSPKHLRRPSSHAQQYPYRRIHGCTVS